MSGGYGPAGKDKWVLKQSVIEFMDNCTDYVHHLSDWKRYMIWRYTFGSGALNRFLIGVRDDPNLKFWIFWTCKFWNDMIKTDEYANSTIEYPMTKYTSWGRDKTNKQLFNPDIVLNMDNNDPKLFAFMQDFAKSLNRVILSTPPVREEFTVVKVSTKYPELPDPHNFRPVMVPQKPFNSTTLDLELNFGFFLSEEMENIILLITIPKGSRVLYIPQLVTAYPWEQEVLLPYGCKFKMEKLGVDRLPYYSKDAIYTRQIQQKPFTIGPVWEIDSGAMRQLKYKDLSVMAGIYVPPHRK